MRSLKPVALTIIFLLSALLNAAHAFADDVDESEYEEHARVMRVSLLRGEVSLRRSGDDEWEPAKLNLPLVEGDTLTTGPDSRLEIQVDAYNFVRVGADSVVRVVTLRDEGVAISLAEGTASLRLARLDADREYFEIDAPKTTVAAERRGLYRLDVADDGGVRVTVRGEGRARVYSESSGFVLRDGKTARLYYDDGEGDWEISAAPASDVWDEWIDERERHLAARLRYQDRERYYDRDVWGAEELDAYGDWQQTNEYGWVWRPHVTVINNYHDWAPYRHGHWRWCPPYGWTWVADEEWGWAPYHYGRWVVYNNNWCWAPRGYGYEYRRAWWRPALVAFVYLPSSHGEHVAWYPLRHGQYDPRGRWWRRHPERLVPLRARDIANLERANPAFLRAVTTLPARDFGGRGARSRAATSDFARRAVTGEPVRGRLPITPSDASGAASTFGRNRVRGTAARPADSGEGASAASTNREPLRIVRPSNRPVRPVPERDTGAAARTPGVPLNEELRRTRVFNGRAPRLQIPSSEGLSRGDERDTGAVDRPARAIRRPSPRVGEDSPRMEAPGGRPPRTSTENDRRARAPVEPGPIDRAEPVERERVDDGGRPNVRRVRPAQPDADRPAESPRANERPATRERERPEPEERRTPPPRRQPPPMEREERHAPPPQQSAPPPPPEPQPERQQPRPPQPERQQPPPQQRPERQTPAPPPQRSEPRGRPQRPVSNKNEKVEVDP